MLRAENEQIRRVVTAALRAAEDVVDVRRRPVRTLAAALAHPGRPFEDKDTHLTQQLIR